MTRAYVGGLSGVLMVVTGLASGVPGATQAQVPERLPRFEVASVKQNMSGPGRTQTLVQPGGRFVAVNAPLKLLIADAFLSTQPLAFNRVLNGPEWIESAHYDINAKATMEFQPSPDGPPQDMLLMLRALLEERFALKTHRETRELPVYELVVARSDGKLGSQLRHSAVDCDALAAARRAGAPPPPARGPLDPPPCRAMRGPARIIAGGIPMLQFASMLTVAVADATGPGGRDQARPVVDKTGLTGRFEFMLTWTPEQMPTAAPPPGVPPIDPNGPSFFTALQEQLGLKLQPAKGPVDVLVIDSVSQPTPD